MKVSVLPALELDGGLRRVWRSLQQSDPALRSPFYHPLFTEHVARSGRDVRVAVLEESSGRIAGFFPHERAGSELRPVGHPLNDYHGPIWRAGVPLDAVQLLRACGATRYHFDHLPLTQTDLAPHSAIRHVSLVCDVSGGWDAYVARLAELDGKRTPDVIRKTRNKERQLERDHGPLRFVRHGDSDAVFDTLVRWKTAQRERTAQLHDDPFVLPWVTRFMALLRQQTSPDFQGSLCALYAGDRLVSCHFGLRSDKTLHLWFPSYDIELASYQPSMVMWLRLLQTSAEDGITLLDFGRGNQRFKTQLSTGAMPMGEGVVSDPAIWGQAWWLRQRLGLRLKNALRDQPWVEPLRARLSRGQPLRVREEKVQRKVQQWRDAPPRAFTA